MNKIFLSLFFPIIVCAQWSNDSQNNLVLSDRSGSQAQPKIVATNDGSAYISWFDDSDGGYDVYLQRLDDNGIEQWAHNGILVADRGYSSTQDYGLSIDSYGNALLAFRDDRDGVERITANRISSAGDLLWGDAGIQVSGTTGFLAAPKIAGTTDGNIVVAWTHDSEVVIQKLDVNGLALWNDGIILAEKGTAFIASDLKASDLGNVIVSMVESTTFSSPKYIFAQKLASFDGAFLWGMTPLPVFDLVNGSLQFGNFPGFISDDDGGAIFTWYTSSPSLNCWVQRVDSSGMEYFVHNGLETSTNASQLRVSPTSAFNPTTQEIYTFWTKLSNNQSQSGVYGQKFDLIGSRQWTDNAKEFAPLSSSQKSFVQTSIINNEPIIAWIDSLSFNNDSIKGTQVDSDGNFNWIPPLTQVGSNSSSDSHLNNAVNSNDFGMYVWSEDSDIKAQNLNLNGSLGVDAIFANGFE